MRAAAACATAVCTATATTATSSGATTITTSAALAGAAAADTVAAVGGGDNVARPLPLAVESVAALGRIALHLRRSRSLAATRFEVAGEIHGLIVPPRHTKRPNATTVE